MVSRSGKKIGKKIEEQFLLTNITRKYIDFFWKLKIF